MSPPKREVQKPALQDIADAEHHRHDNRERDERVDAEEPNHHDSKIGGHHNEIAVRDVDDAHHAEHQR